MSEEYETLYSACPDGMFLVGYELGGGADDGSLAAGVFLKRDGAADILWLMSPAVAAKLRDLITLFLEDEEKRKLELAEVG